MELPLQLTFRDLPHSDAIADYVRKKAEKLDTFYDRITSCRVAVESPHRHKHEGRPYRIRIDLGVPGNEIVVSRDVGGFANEDVYATIDAAFDDAQRRLQDHAALLRGEVKQHDRASHGVIAKLFTYEGYGFISTNDGDELYFHRNSVLNHGFDRMRVGMKVRYVEEEGEDGVHATSVVVPRSQTKKPSVRPPPT